MSETAPLSLPDAARHLGVSLRVLRQAIRAGRIPAPPALRATATVPAAWLESAEAAITASPKALTAVVRQKVPAFARFKGTSAWQKYRVRAHEYGHFRAAEAKAAVPG